MIKLPEISLTPKLEEDLNQLYLDFLSAVYISAYKNKELTTSTGVWFLQEIGYFLYKVYPQKTTEELEQILVHINALAKRTKEKA